MSGHCPICETPGCNEMRGLSIREQADRINEDALELIKGVMQKHTAAILEAMKGEIIKQREKARSLTHELEAEKMDNGLQAQLAASQYREAKLREALHLAESALDDCQDYPMTYMEVIEALSIPTDDTALRELIEAQKQELQAMHKLVEDTAKSYARASNEAAALRAQYDKLLGAVKAALEDSPVSREILEAALKGGAE